MPQAGQMTFELPYVIFGLGATPNFVEKLTVGLPPNAQSVRFLGKTSFPIVSFPPVR